MVESFHEKGWMKEVRKMKLRNEKCFEFYTNCKILNKVVVGGGSRVFFNMSTDGVKSLPQLCYIRGSG